MSTHQAQRLFDVTLSWNPSNEEEGDYRDKTWAADESTAIRIIATQMAHHEDSGCETDDERATFVETLVSEAGPYAAELVEARVLDDLRELLSGHENVLCPAAQADFEAIAAILTKYGVDSSLPGEVALSAADNAG